MRKNAATKLMALFMALLLAVTMLPVGDLTAQAAAKKPGAVTKIKKIEVNPTNVILTYNKAKNAKGYQVRVYKGKKLVKSLKTRDTACTVKGLSAETKYTIKVRAYNGSKYGKEKSLTLKTETKNLAVTGLKALSVTKESVKVKYNKAKNAKGYQIRVYKGSKRVSEVKTKNTSCTIGKLQEGTEYTVKIKAYKGKKFGKEKSIIVKTARGESDSTEDDSNTDDTPGIVMPGESTSTGDALVAEYNAYVAYEAEQWKKLSLDELRDIVFPHMGAGITYNTQYTDKYSLFKYKAGTEEPICEMYADILNIMGIPAEKRDVLADAQRFPEVKDCLEGFKNAGFTSGWGVMYVSPFPGDKGHKKVKVVNVKGSTGYDLTYLETKEAQSMENWEIVAHCPYCGEEFFLKTMEEYCRKETGKSLNGLWDSCNAPAEKTDWFGQIVKSLEKDKAEGRVWEKDGQILCETKDGANAVADLIQALYGAQGESVVVTTGYYDNTTYKVTLQNSEKPQKGQKP